MVDGIVSDGLATSGGMSRRRHWDLGTLDLARLALVASVPLSPLPAGALDYDESIDGDLLSNDANDPTLIGVLDPGLDRIASAAPSLAPAAALLAVARCRARRTRRSD
jgi:hypothetical protein